MTTRQAKLSRSEILSAAVALVDERGVEALSMRSLAAELGVEAMSIYNHVASKDALLDGIVETVLDDVHATAAVGTWQEALRELALRHRAVALSHPRVMLLFSTRTVTSPAWRRAVEDTFAALQGAGFAADEAVSAYRIFWCFVVGYMHLELRNAESPGLDAYLAALPAEDYPATHAHARALAEAERDTEFRRGVELVLDALERDRAVAPDAADELAGRVERLAVQARDVAVELGAVRSELAVAMAQRSVR
jgi:AcrR family transcriptional regulator